jgi:hypothetical protein
MTTVTPTEYLELAAAGWLNHALRHAGDEGCHAANGMRAGAFDLRIVWEMRAGKVKLECFTEDKRCLVYCEDVPPLRPDAGFGATSDAMQ